MDLSSRQWVPRDVHAGGIGETQAQVALAANQARQSGPVEHDVLLRGAVGDGDAASSLDSKAPSRSKSTQPNKVCVVPVLLKMETVREYLVTPN